MTAGVVEPRYPTFKGIMDAKKKPVDTKTAGDLGVDIQVDQRIVMVVPAPSRSGGQVVIDDGDGHEKIVAMLEQAKVI